MASLELSYPLIVSRFPNKTYYLSQNTSIYIELDQKDDSVQLILCALFKHNKTTLHHGASGLDYKIL